MCDTPGREFLIDGDKIVTRREALSKARGLAARLGRLSLDKGTRVALLLPDPAEAVIAFMALLLTDLVAVPLDPKSPTAAISRVLADCSAGAVILGESLADKIDFQASAIIFVDFQCRDTAAESPHMQDSAAPDQLALILYTSGTTGQPKGVTFTRANLCASTEIHAYEFFRLDHTDTILMTTPLTSNYGITFCLVALCVGARLSILWSVKPKSAALAIRRDGVTFVAGVSSLGELLLKGAGSRADPYPSLRRMLIAGTALQPDLATRIETRFQVELMVAYGMTEAAPLAFSRDWRLVPEKSVGPPSKQS